MIPNDIKKSVHKQCLGNEAVSMLKIKSIRADCFVK